MLEQILEKKIKRNYSYGKDTRFGVGGAVKRFLVSRDEDTLIMAIKLASKNNWPLAIVGEGTNLIISDGMVDCFVIRNKILGIKMLGSNRCEVGAGESLTKVISFLNNKGLAGIESMYGVPGSIGGAIAGNAGCYGQEIKDVVAQVKVFDGNKVKWLDSRQCKFGYRNSIFKENRRLTILKAVLSLVRASHPLLLKVTSRKIIKLRNMKFSKDLKCSGSYFKNIVLGNLDRNTREKLENSFSDKIKGGKLATAVLVEAVGLKGKTIGKIQISKQHGNLVLNMGRGKAKDVLKLVDLARAKVYERFGVLLEDEVRIV